MYLKKIFVLLTILSVTLLSILACASNQAGTELPSPEQEKPKEKDLPNKMPQLEKGNPKLGSALWQLIEAEKRGEAESFARQGDIKLVDGGVLVTMESVPGQVEAAAKAAINAGAQHLQAGSIGITKDWLDAVVPITSLEALANEESIRFIALPVRGVPE
ncbi:MAG: hypothetical protein Q8Q41_03105 [bacterium]|nr:hypothetical protein [bacterium]